ncbi:MAG: TolC family protein [Myxococcales bacterium]|nr:TolC family protein [Myxococcales bacterium]
MRVSITSILVVASAAAAEPLTLAQLIERARANDHRVKEAQAQLKVFQAKYNEAKWAWFPRIDSYLAFAGPTPEAKNDGLGGAPTTKASLMYDLDFGPPGVTTRAGADGVMPIFTFGKLDALEEAGKKGVEAGQALQTRAEDEAELQVSQAFYGYCLAASGKRVIADTLTRLDDARKTLERLRKEESEQVTQMDVYKIDYYRNLVQAQLTAADSGSTFALSAIRLLIAAKPGEELQIVEEELKAQEGTLPPVETYLATAEQLRPELKAIGAGIAAREQEVLIRERMFYPDLGIAGFFRWAWTTNATRQYSPFAYDPYNDLSAGLLLVARYQWDFPQKSAQLAQARAELQKMQHQRDLLASAVRMEIEKAWSDTKAGMDRSAKLALAEKEARRWATAAFTAFDIGTGDTRELVDAFTAYAQSSLQHAQADYDTKIGMRSLARAVGAKVELLPPSEPKTPAAPLQPR